MRFLGVIGRIARLLGHAGDAHGHFFHGGGHVRRSIALDLRIARDLAGRLIDLLGQILHGHRRRLNVSKAFLQLAHQPVIRFGRLPQLIMGFGFYRAGEIKAIGSQTQCILQVLNRRQHRAANPPSHQQQKQSARKQQEQQHTARRSISRLRGRRRLRGKNAAQS